MWAGQTLSRLGNYIYAAGIGVLAYHITRSASSVGIVVGAFSTTQLCLIFLGGVIADRVPRRLIVFYTDTAAAILMLALGVDALLREPALWEMTVTSGALGILAALHLPAYRSITPEIVTGDELVAASALSSAVNPVTILIGPAIGAGLTALGGGALCLIIDSGTFIVAALTMIPVVRQRAAASVQDRSAQHRVDALRAIAGGFSIIRASRPILLFISVGALAVALVEAPLPVLLPLQAARSGWGNWVVGATLAATGIGTVLMSIFTSKLANPLAERIYVISFSLGGIPLMIGALSGSRAVWLVSSVVTGALMGTRYMRYALIQRTVSADSLGRVFSVDTFASIALAPLIAISFGFIATHTSVTLILVCCACVNVLAVPTLTLALREKEIPSP